MPLSARAQERRRLAEQRTEQREALANRCRGCGSWRYADDDCTACGRAERRETYAVTALRAQRTRTA